MTRPEEAVDYVHFENEIEAEAFDRSQKKVLDYEILGAQIINENLYVFTLDLKKIHNTYPKATLTLYCADHSQPDKR